MLRLRAVWADQVATVPLAGALTIGSARGNDLAITANGVSRLHACTVVAADGSIEIIDRGSKNGIVAGRRRVDRCPLKPGTRLRIGEASLIVEEVSTSDVELALPLTRGSHDHRAVRSAGSTSAESCDPASGSAAALRLVRDLEADPSPTVRNILDRARDILEADSLLAYSVRGDDLDLATIVGRVPTEEEFRALVSPRTERWLIAGSEGPMSIAATSSSAALREPWQADFLDYLRIRLLTTPEQSRPRGNQESEKPCPQLVSPQSELFQRTVSAAARIAAGDIDVLITGESGAGKEVIARLVHSHSGRSGRPFVAINCAAVAPELLEAEMFGIQRGVATGVEARPGHFLSADGGTILLDEIADMAPGLQAKLLRVLQEREVVPVGSSRGRRIDVRVISSTNRDPREAVAAGLLRQDLYYRLRGAEIHVPPLRARKDDIPALAFAFAEEAARAFDHVVTGITRRALRRLMDYDWPGNVRELQHAIRRAVLLCPRGGAIEAAHLDLHDRRDEGRGMLEDVERLAIRNALERANGNVTRAARILGISRQALYNKKARFGID